MVDGEADHPGGREGLDEVDLARRSRRRHVGEVAQHGPCRRVLQDHRVGSSAPQDEARGEVGGVAERPLAFDDDHGGVLGLEGLDDGGLELARAELARDRVERHAVARALDDAGLPRADHDRLDAVRVQRTRQDGGRRALADRAVGAEHGDARAGDRRDAAVEHAQILLVARAAHVQDAHAVRRLGRRELRVVVEELVQAIDDAHAPTHGGEHDAALQRREHAAQGGHAEDEEVRYAPGEDDRVRHVGADRDAVRLVVEIRAGVEPGLGTVDHGQDLVLLRVTHQAVRGLAVTGTEEGLAVDDGGSGRFSGQGYVHDTPSVVADPRAWAVFRHRRPA